MRIEIDLIQKKVPKKAMATHSSYVVSTFNYVVLITIMLRSI